MVRDMGTFDDWQAQKDSQYLTLTDYITELAKAENSSIKATLLYLINHKENLKLYKKSIDGNYHKIAYDDLFDCFEDNALDDALKELLTYIEQTPYFHDFNFIGNDFSKKLYKNVYVKKVGVSRIEPVAPSEPKAGEIKPHDEPIELGENQLLMKDYPSFTPHELACFLSDKDPDYINNNNFTDFNLSERLVYKALSNGYLSKNVNEEIKNQEAKEYLHSIGKIYKGFNDNLPPVTADKIGHATITQTMPTDSQLSQQVADLKAQLASAGDKIDSQAELIAELKEQLASIEQAGKDTQSDTPAIVDKLLTGNSQSAVTKLIYSFMREHNYPLDGKHKGAVNETLQKLTNSYKVGIAEDTIAKWLKLVNELDQKLK